MPCCNSSGVSKSVKRVYQTVMDEHKGNCLSAAIASVLELDIGEVPNFDVLNGDFIDRVNTWLEPRGLGWVRIIMPRQDRGPDRIQVGRLPESGDEFVHHKLPEGIICLATGKSPRGEWCHSVVGRMVGGYNFELLHDPHPGGLGIEGLPLCIEFLVPLNPRVGVNPEYYCPEHKYNPPPNSGFALCPQCEIIAGNWGRDVDDTDFNVGVYIDQD